MNQPVVPRPQGDANRPKRILFDMSFTCLSGKTSGIERVVRSLHTAGLAWQQARMHKSSFPEFIPVFASQGQFYRLDQRAQSLLAPLGQFERDCLSVVPYWYRLLAWTLCRIAPLPWLRRQLLPSTGHLGIFKSWHRHKKKKALANAASGQDPLKLCADDIVWLPDAYWAQASVWSAAEHAQQQGALVASLVYDLIPLRSGTFNQGFYRYLHQLLDNSHVALCISDCERQQLEAFQAASDSRFSSCITFRTVTLGCDIQHSEDEVRPQFACPFESPSKQPLADNDHPSVYLCVNTFDPRKNHALLLEAFDHLWSTGNDVRLCLVGRLGWQYQEIARRISGHKELNRRLFVFHDATDAEINYCYQRARAVITASKDEGFGLPIVESLSRGRTTLASDIPIHREVGGHSCHYFALTNTAELVLLVQQCELSQLPHVASACSTVAMRPKIQTWQQSFEQCQHELVTLFEHRLARRAAA